ncbi:MAG TPA: hypothetical protein VL092_01620 [Chitinophagaceae bacterium]|nr:hypothetical protein [Chitinophagaceae bacterium]
MHTKYQVRTVIAGLLFGVSQVLSSCSETKETGDAIVYRAFNDSLLASARSGDVVLRCGRDELSKLFSRLNTRDQSYSHCGVLSCTDSGQYVTHIIGDNHHSVSDIVYEPVAAFIRPEMNKRWALVRYDLDSVAQESFLQGVHLLREQGIRFDVAFDLLTDDRMYCTELVYKLLLQASADSGYLKPTISSSGRKYIAIDNLFGNVHSTTICAISYK